MINRAIAFVAVVLILASSIPASAQVPSARVPCAAVVTEPAARGMSGPIASWDRVYDAGEQCVHEWADSLRSPVAERASLARQALELMGGRAAVDALRAEYARAPSEALRYALIDAIGSTGSPDDIAFLETQLSGPLTGVPNVWPRIQLVLNTLGLLRAGAARDSIQAVLRRSDRSSFVHEAAVAALAALDRPPCEGVATADDPKTFVAIVMRCAPQAMSTRAHYRDHDVPGVWVFDNDTWSLTTRTPADSAAPLVATSVRVASDGRHAEVTLSTWCGRLCGEGWSYRLLRVGEVWRVVRASMQWVS
jgi:hypothetical protein